MSIGLKIKYFRKQAGLTQSALAEILQVSSKTVRRYESDEREPTIKVLSKIAKALDVKTVQLLESDSDDLIKIPVGDKIATRKILEEEGLEEYQLSIFGPIGLRSEDLDNAAKLLLRFFELTEKGQQKVLSYAFDLSAVSQYQTEQFKEEVKRKHLFE